MSRHVPLRKKRPAEQPGLVQKGSSDALRIDWKDLERTIAFLRKNYAVKLNEANKKMQTAINKIKEIDSSLHQTSSHEDFYKLIVRNFSDLRPEDIEPGTIGSFCYGCHIVKGFDGARSCAPTCLGSIADPVTSGWADCDSNIFLIYRDGDNKIYWKDLQTVGFDKMSYVFLMDDFSTTQDTASETKVRPELYATDETLLAQFHRSHVIDESLLAEKGIKKYTLYELKNGAHRFIKTGIVQKSAPERFCPPASDTWLDGRRRKSQASIGGFIVLFPLILVFLVIFAYMFTRTRRSK